MPNSKCHLAKCEYVSFVMSLRDGVFRGVPLLLDRSTRVSVSVFTIGIDTEAYKVAKRSDRQTDVAIARLGFYLGIPIERRAIRHRRLMCT